MARSSYRLDLKRDDPRTLMIKMDARLTFAGRERNHAFRIEAERELRHLDYARHLTRSTLERQQKEMHKRMDFLKDLVEKNRARRKQMDVGNDSDEKVIFESDGETALDRKKRKENGLRHTLPIIPARRNLEDLVNSLQRKQSHGTSNLSRSLGYLSESYTRHKTHESLSERRLRQLKQEMRDARKKDIPKVQITSENERPTETPKVVWASADGIASVAEKQTSPNGLATQVISLPDITAGSKKLANGATAGRRVSLSRMIANGEITKLPGISANGSSVTTTDGASQNLNMARTFYMNTSQTSSRGPVLQPIHTSPQQQQNGHGNKRGWVKLPPNMLPLKFTKDDIEQNPFMSADFKPDTYRSRELLESNKPEEMYVWLGFDSEEEFREMVAQAKEEIDAESDGNSSHGGDDVVDLEVIDEVEENDGGDDDGGIEKAGAEYLRKRKTSRRVSRLSAPVAMLASSLNRGMSASGKNKPNSALRKFIKAAKTICIVRQFQMNKNENEVVS